MSYPAITFSCPTAQSKISRVCLFAVEVDSGVTSPEVEMLLRGN